MKIRKLILFLVGFCLYITLEVCFRGYSFVLMGICGGIIFILLDCINEVLPWDTDILIQGSIGSAMITLTELIVGEGLKYLGLSQMWDYSNLPINFDGVICLPYSLLWILVSIIGIIVADAINYYVFKIMPVPYYKLFGKTILKFKR